jgi:hypothetical protein
MAVKVWSKFQDDDVESDDADDADDDDEDDVDVVEESAAEKS